MILSLTISALNVICVIAGVETGSFDGWTYGNLFFAVLLAYQAGTEK